MISCTSASSNPSCATRWRKRGHQIADRAADRRMALAVALSGACLLEPLEQGLDLVAHSPRDGRGPRRSPRTPCAILRLRLPRSAPCRRASSASDRPRPGSAHNRPRSAPRSRGSGHSRGAARRRSASAAPAAARPTRTSAAARAAAPATAAAKAAVARPVAEVEVEAAGPEAEPAPARHEHSRARSARDPRPSPTCIECRRMFILSFTMRLRYILDTSLTRAVVQFFARRLCRARWPTCFAEAIQRRRARRAARRTRRSPTGCAPPRSTRSSGRSI